MTYDQALKQLGDSKFQKGDLFFTLGADNIGFVIANHKTDEMIISQPESWQEVFNKTDELDGDNKKALEILELFNDKLEIILISDLNNPIIQTLTKHLLNQGHLKKQQY